MIRIYALSLLVICTTLSHVVHSQSSENICPLTGEKICRPSCSDLREIEFARNAPCVTDEGTCIQRCLPECFGAHSAFIPRSQGADTARELIGWQSILYGQHAQHPYAYAPVIEYSRSYKPELISEYLFNRTGFLTLRGSSVEDRQECDLLADYFGLSNLYQGQLHISPLIDNIYFDNQFFISLESITCGLYGRINAPLVHTRWNLRACERVQEKGTAFPPCYMSTQESEPCSSLEQSLSGCCTFGNLAYPLRYGKFNFNQQTMTKLADIDLILGYNIYQRPEFHLGLYLQAVAPTGSKFDPEYIFNPIVGNAHHWELGAGLTAHKVLYQLSPDAVLTAYLEGNATHMFKNCQLRSYDFSQQGDLSRYMLLKEFEADGTTPTGSFIPAINITTLPTDVSVRVKGDFSLKIAYEDACGLHIDLGYNIYGKSAESLTLSATDFHNTDSHTYGFKGTEGTCSLTYTDINDQFGSLESTNALNATQYDAHIKSGGTTDNPEPITAPGTVSVAWNSIQSGSTDQEGVVRARSSEPPRLISMADLNINSGAACASLTHGLFAYIGFIQDTFLRRDITSSLGIGAKVEFQPSVTGDRRIINQNVYPAQRDSRFINSLDQWNIFAKGALSF
jgi:hypothetical protein